MNICIISCFRNAAGAQIDRYCTQMDELQKALHERGDRLTLVLGYGDSIDGTGEELFEACSHRFDALLVDVSHGGKHYGSIEHPQRFKQLAFVGNKLLDCVPADADVVGIVESDLVWDAETLIRLIDDLEHVPAVAPMVMDGPISFYDVFVFRKNGIRFEKKPPYCEWLDKDMMQVDSAGSVLFVRADLARKARLSNGEAIVGFCDNINQAGGSIWLDPAAAVQHP